MKSLFAGLAGLGIVGFVFGCIFLVFAPLALTLYGLILAFKASVLVGVLALLIEPTPFLLGLLALLGHPEIAQRIANWIAGL